MEPNYVKESPRRQRSAEEIIRLLEEFEASDGITVKDFCEIHDISDATYYNWRKLYGSKAREEKTAGFIELVSTSIEPSIPSGLFAEVRGVKIYQPVTADYLKALIL